MHNENRIALLYLGSKGAGVKFMEILATQLPIFGQEIDLIFRRNESQFESGVRTIRIEISRFRFFVWLGYGKRRAKNQILEDLRRLQIKILVIPMSHPWDLSFQKTLQAKGVKVIRLIHDPNRHPGDLWPLKKDIKKMCNADCVITLSAYTASLLRKYSSNSVVSCMPSLIFSLPPNETKCLEQTKEYDLIIGRQKSYQNTITVVKWWTKLQPDIKQDRQLIVAGKLTFFAKFCLKGLPRVTLLNRWLSDNEFGKLIHHANRVICIYREASQSGIIAAAQSCSTPVLVSDVGGLREQIEEFGGGLVTTLNSKSEWQESYEGLSEGKFISSNMTSATPRFVDSILAAIASVNEK